MSYFDRKREVAAAGGVIGAAIAFLAFGFWQVYGKSRQTHAEGSDCASTTTDRVVKTALWIATGLVVIALTVDLWAPLFY